mgnify:CR=1 FL=1
MISLKSLMKNVKEAKITSPKKGVSTPLDAKIQISGYGVMTRGQLQKNIVRLLHEASKYVKRGNFRSTYSVLFKRDLIKGFLETEMKHDGEK